jgi:DNA-binding beta-propeller fold protein YncE
VNGISPDQIDRQLGEWLREESLTRAPAGLVEDIFARSSRTPQASRWWPPQPDLVRDIVGRVGRGQPRQGPHSIHPRRAPTWRRAGSLAGVMTIVLIAVVLGVGVSRPGIGPGAIASSSPSVTVSPSLPPSASPSLAGPLSPAPTVLGTLSAQRLDLGPDAGPISVTEAFGSIWLADIHADDVRRFEPTTMREIARIPVPGAAWFAVADGALWVTNQVGTGLTRIDPVTNTVVAHVGDVAPCSAPVVAFGSLWQAACDANVILRINPATTAIIDTIPADGHRFLVLAGNRLIAVGTKGLASFDPGKRTFTTIANPAAIGAQFLASDGTTVWVQNSAGVARIDPADGRTIAGFSSPDAQGIAFAGDHAWLAVRNQGVLEVDLATNEVTRTIPVLPAPLNPFEAGGVLWVTDFDNSTLWRIEL